MDLAVITTETNLHQRMQATIKPAAWGYVRVSSDKQEDGQSPEAQADEIKAYAAEKFPNLQLAIVQEAASAALPMFNVALPGMRHSGPSSMKEAPRPLLGMLLASLCDRPGSHLIVWKLDRLARVATEQDLFLSLLTRHHVTLHTAYASERHLVDGVGSPEDDPLRHLMRSILASFAEYERHLIGIRMRLGTRKKASKGGWVGGKVPFGYDTKGGELVINPVNAQSVVYAFWLREQNNYTLRAIAETLQAQGASGIWHKVRVGRVLGNRRLYTGIYDDPYAVAHARPDLKILPDNWDDYTEKMNEGTKHVPA